MPKQGPSDGSRRQIDRPLADPVQPVAQAHRGRRLALAGRRRVDRGDQHELAVGPVAEPVDEARVELGDVPAVVDAARRRGMPSLAATSSIGRRLAARAISISDGTLMLLASQRCVPIMPQSGPVRDCHAGGGSASAPGGTPRCTRSASSSQDRSRACTSRDHSSRAGARAAAVDSSRRAGVIPTRHRLRRSASQQTPMVGSALSGRPRAACRRGATGRAGRAPGRGRRARAARLPAPPPSRRAPGRGRRSSAGRRAAARTGRRARGPPRARAPPARSRPGPPRASAAARAGPRRARWRGRSRPPRSGSSGQANARGLSRDRWLRRVGRSARPAQDGVVNRRACGGVPGGPSVPRRAAWPVRDGG